MPTYVFGSADYFNEIQQKFLPSSDDEDSVDTWGLNVEASNLGAVGLCLRAGFQ